MIFFIADMYLGNEAIIKMCDRPFEDADEMDMFIIEMWNGKVSENDTVYIIGDMFHGHKDPESVLRELKGKKILITDDPDGMGINKLDYSKYFLSVGSFAKIPDGKRRLILCHYPLLTWRDEEERFMIHGYIRNNTDMKYWPFIKNNPRILNAGVDINGFSPVTFEQLRINNECFKEGLRLSCSDYI